MALAARAELCGIVGLGLSESARPVWRRRCGSLSPVTPAPSPSDRPDWHTLSLHSESKLGSSADRRRVTGSASRLGSPQRRSRPAGPPGASAASHLALPDPNPPPLLRPRAMAMPSHRSSLRPAGRPAGPAHRPRRTGAQRGVAGGTPAARRGGRRRSAGPICPAHAPIVACGPQVAGGGRSGLPRGPAQQSGARRPQRGPSGPRARGPGPSDPGGAQTRIDSDAAGPALPVAAFGAPGGFPSGPASRLPGRACGRSGSRPSRAGPDGACSRPSPTQRWPFQFPAGYGPPPPTHTPARHERAGRAELGGPP